MIEFFVPGNPKGKGRPRFTRAGHAYTPAVTANYETFIRELCREAMGTRAPLTGPVRVELTVGKPVPGSKPKRTKQAMLAGEIRPCTAPDLDNIAKAVLDACNGVAYLDDKQIVELSAEAWYVVEPGVRVRIGEVCRAEKPV